MLQSVKLSKWKDVLDVFFYAAVKVIFHCIEGGGCYDRFENKFDSQKQIFDFLWLWNVMWMNGHILNKKRQAAHWDSI